MLTIKDIYQKFDNIGCLSFTTINHQGEPESRIAHLRAHDDEGLYFMTMFTKDFYQQLKTKKTISLCGLCAPTQIEHDEKGFPIFQGGYAMRMTGTAQEISIEDIKAKQNPAFDFCIKDQEKYPAMVVFCITDGYGDIFDYDFEKIQRESKLQREYFSYNGRTIKEKGLGIDTNECIECGLCEEACSFLAIQNTDNGYTIDIHRCDECGDCYLSCPVQAISYRGK